MMRLSSTLGRTIRAARRACRLTQKQLAMRLGVHERAVYRWERAACAPRRRLHAALVSTIQQLNPAAGTALAAALASVARGPVAPSRLAPAPVAPTVAPVAPEEVMERALFVLAEELDVPARRARVALARWQKRLRESGVGFDIVQRHIEGWSALEASLAGTQLFASASVDGSAAS